MYVATALRPADRGLSPQEANALGVFDDEVAAVEAVSENYGRLRGYDYVVIEKIPCGLMREVESIQWFKFEEEFDIYLPIDPPDGLGRLKIPFWRSAYEIC